MPACHVEALHGYIETNLQHLEALLKYLEEKKWYVEALLKHLEVLPCYRVLRFHFFSAFNIIL